MNGYSLLLVLVSLVLCNGYKFLVYSPIFGYSHTKFMGTLADALTEAGHDVTVLMPVVDIEEEHKTGLKLTKNIIKIPANPRILEFLKNRKNVLGKMWTMKPGPVGLVEIVKTMSDAFTSQCEVVINDDELMKRLREEKFDVGIAETFSVCGFGIFEVAKIPSSMAAFSGVHMDAISVAIVEPTYPSYDKIPEIFHLHLKKISALADPRVTAFITHGGLGSITELAYAGKPAVLIPLFGDQSRNGLMLARHGGAIVLSKHDLLDPAKLKHSLEEIFTDDRKERKDTTATF
ncbi:hypothetical protein OESDEN_12654 [Oesophagostomum dentatum]|uniref:glucuronosyltransferase n=1 Tax=Oesophagostomum dentatum TaxID=61180 RepID=A0A0B1SWL2_OESDE|nr:hypothetical protein OESDEN_12654 [Oesophagostomum dentatum]